jgi:hypothetical protein
MAKVKRDEERKKSKFTFEMTYCPFSIVFKKSINWQYPRSQLLVFAHG